MQPQDDQFQPMQPNQMAQPAPVFQPQQSMPTQVYAAAAQPVPTVVVSPSNVVPDMAPPAPPQQPAFTGNQTAPKGHMLRNASLAVAGLVVVVGLVLGGFVMTGGLTRYNRTQATNTAVSFIGFLNNNQDAKAYQASSSNLRNAQTESQFSQNLGDLTAKEPKFSGQSVQVKGNKAVYTATVDGLPATESGRTDGVFTIALVKHGLTTWQVDSVQVE